MPREVAFKISARTAKLLGQENFTNPEGAVIELVKNSYDADAKSCYVIFSITHETIPTRLSISQHRQLSKTDQLINQSYRRQKNKFELKSSLPQTQLTNLQNFFFKENSIYIIDNGDGMTQQVIEDHWMQIGTGNKNLDYVSKDGRIKTGAKGIGRFALDRLGIISEMWTIPAESKEKSSYWTMDWAQFEKSTKSLHEIKAQLSDCNLNIKQILANEFSRKTALLNKFNEVSFKSGTIIKISSLKDSWHAGNLASLYRALEAMVPPKELAIPFQVFLFNQNNLKEYGEIDTAFFNDFDYKVEGNYDSHRLTMDLKITRNELDLKELTKKHQSVFKNSKAPYDIATLRKKTFSVSKPIFEYLEWEKNPSNSISLRNLGSLSFTFFYLKITSPSERYPYRSINIQERQKILKRFGGFKIYRDSFRVRPYGDQGNDWLELGERAAQSPAGAGQRIGDWRVGPNQIAGLTVISRVVNPNLVDKSDRGALIENEAFDLLRKIIISAIAEFELDRTIILNKFYLIHKEAEEKRKEDEVMKEAEKIAERLVQERLEIERKLGFRPDLFRESKINQERESFERIILEELKTFEASEDKDAEISQVRTLASLGLIVASFAHELKEVKNNTGEIKSLEKIYTTLIDKSLHAKKEYINGLDILELLLTDSERIAHWVEYSLTAVKKDKRKRTTLKFDNFFTSLSRQWKKVLDDRNIILDYRDYIKSEYLFKAFEMDMSTIFSNLISNSIDAINLRKSGGQRKISISTKLVKENAEIHYHDTGIGLSTIFKNEKDRIFLPFTTSKKDRDGNDIGTGLGMYLAKNVVDDNNGDIEILTPKIGFEVKITFPIRKK